MNESRLCEEEGGGGELCRAAEEHRRDSARVAAVTRSPRNNTVGTYFLRIARRRQIAAINIEWKRDNTTTYDVGRTASYHDHAVLSLWTI